MSEAACVIFAEYASPKEAASMSKLFENALAKHATEVTELELADPGRRGEATESLRALAKRFGSEWRGEGFRFKDQPSIFVRKSDRFVAIYVGPVLEPISTPLENVLDASKAVRVDSWNRGIHVELRRLGIDGPYGADLREFRDKERAAGRIFDAPPPDCKIVVAVDDKKGPWCWCLSRTRVENGDGYDAFAFRLLLLRCGSFALR